MNKIEKQIKDYEDVLNDPKTPADEKEFAKGEIAELKAKLAKGDKKPAAKAKHEKKAAKKSAAKKTGKKKSPATAEMPSCEELLTKWEERRAAAKANSKKKSKPVFESIAEKVESAVMKAAKNVDKADIKNNPGDFIKKMEKIQDSTKTFLTSLKQILGDDYDSEEVQAIMKDFDKFIAEIKKKYNGTKMEDGGEVLPRIAEVKDGESTDTASGRITQNRSSQYCSCILPSGTEWIEDGEITHDRKSAYEVDIVDVDGTIVHCTFEWTN